MDHNPVNHQNPHNLDDCFHYFNQDLFRHDDALFNLLDMNRVSSHYFSDLGFSYFDPVDEDISLWECWGDGHVLPLLSSNDDHNGGGSGDHGGRRPSRPLELEEIEKHFELPIVMEAEKLKVGLTMLKKRCRELNIKRWPHRKLKSIKSLIQNVKVQIFARMNQPVLDAICERIKPHTYIKEGTTLYKGGFVTKMVFIVRGKMESKGEDGNSVILSDGDVCGEELLTWCLEPSSLNGDTRNKLVSKRTVTCLTKVEAFVLQAADLEQAITRSDAFPDESSEQISIVVESGGNHHSGDTEIQEEEA